MKHRDLIRRLRAIARRYGAELVLDGGTNHEKWYVGKLAVMVPRHREINEHTARTIIRDLERALKDAETKAGEDG
jgi:mRNA interferase HicA